MQPNELRKKLHGVIAFPVTPFKKDLSLDLDGLRGNLRSLLKHPVCAVVAAAGTGELYSLSPAEHLQVVKTTLAEVNGRVPVIAGAGFNPPIAAELAQQAAAAGVSRRTRSRRCRRLRRRSDGRERSAQGTSREP